MICEYISIDLILYIYEFIYCNKKNKFLTNHRKLYIKNKIRIMPPKPWDVAKKCKVFTNLYL